MGLLHSSILSILPDVRVVAICEKNPLVRKIARKMLIDKVIVKDILELSKFNLDAAYITTPPSSHSAIVKVLYSNKITNNIFIEKPLATTYEEANELSKIAHQYGGTNMVGFNKRFAVTFKKAKETLASRTVGDIYSFNVQVCSSDFFRVKRSVKQGFSRGGVLLDLGCHAIDMLIWLLGDLSLVSSELISQTHNYSEDAATIKAKTKDNISGTFHISWLMEGYRIPRTDIEIICSKGSIRVSEDSFAYKLNNGDTRTFHKHDLNDSPSFFLGESDYYFEDDTFIKALSTGSQVENNIHFATKTNKFIDAVKAGVWVDG